MSKYDIFVFGSNLKGYHGAGAALYARQFKGAQPGVGRGLSGSSYAIPTKDERLLSLARPTIFDHIQDFIRFTHETPDKVFLLSRVGCGYAKYDDVDIAPMFRGVKSNVIVPQQWLAYVTIPGWEPLKHYTYKK